MPPEKIDKQRKRGKITMSPIAAAAWNNTTVAPHAITSTGLPTSAPALDVSSSHFNVGSQVRISGLNATQYNGLTGVIISAPDIASGRVGVRVTLQGSTKTLDLKKTVCIVLATSATARLRPPVLAHGGRGVAGPYVIDTIMEAVDHNDGAYLLRLARSGVRLTDPTPLVVAASNGANVDMIRRLIKDLHADVNNAAEKHGFTAVSKAAQYGRRHTRTHTHTHTHTLTHEYTCVNCL
jgi:hypothetical protein